MNTTTPTLAALNKPINLSDYSIDAQNHIKYHGLLKPNGALHKKNVMKMLIINETRLSPMSAIIATRRVLAKCKQLFGEIYTTEANAHKAMNKVINGMGYVVMTPELAIWLVIDELRASNETGEISTKKAVLRGITIFGGALYKRKLSRYMMHRAIVDAGMQPNTQIIYSDTNGVYTKKHPSYKIIRK